MQRRWLLLVPLLVLVLAGLGSQREARQEEARRACEQRLHLLAKGIETAKNQQYPPIYVSCLAELEQIQGKRQPSNEEYDYRPEPDRLGYQIFCKVGHGGRWPAYAKGRGVMEGLPPN